MGNEGVVYKNIIMGSKAQKKLLAGVQKVATVVASTLGPRGHNVILGKNPFSPVVTNDGVTIAKDIRLEDKLEDIGAQVIIEAASKANETAGDGPQDLNSKILTPTGWIRMGDIKEGMEICGTNGTAQKVIGVFPKGKKEKYEVYFSGSGKVTCCEDHLWSVVTSNGVHKTLPLKTIMKDYSRPHPDGGRIFKYFIPATAVEFKEDLSKMPIDPYFLGVLLGDGSLSASHRGSIEISIGKSKEHILEKIVLPENVEMRSVWNDTKNYFRVKFTGKNEQGNTAIKTALEAVGLLGTTSHTKFIPEGYLYSSKASRTALLQGLIDTDGHVNKRGLFEFTSVNRVLAYNFIELCRSLGKQITFREKNRVGGGGYSENPVFCVGERVGYKHGNKLVDIKATGEFTEMQCIKVSNPDNLYITDDYIVTHNTTSTVILTEAIYEGADRYITSGVDRMAIKRGLIKIEEFLQEEIKKVATPIKGIEDLKKIAIISSNNDEELGTLITEALNKVGEDGVITVENSKSYATTVEYTEGVELYSGYVSPYMITDAENMKSELVKPLILLTDEKIIGVQQILPYLDHCHKNGTPFLLISEGVEGDAMLTMIKNNLEGRFRSCAIQAPMYGNKRMEVLEDLAVITGGTVVSKEKGLKIADGNLGWLGTAEKVTITREKTIIKRGAGKPETIIARANELRANMSEQLSSFEVEKIQERIAKLTGGIAVILVGAPTEQELKEKKHRIEDALSATRSAAELGYIPGAAKVPLYLSTLLDTVELEGDEIYAKDIMKKALVAPLTVLCNNSGISPFVVMHIIQDMPLSYGLNARNLTYVDLVEEGIIDPAKVLSCAIKFSVSAASMLISSDGIVYPVDEKKSVGHIDVSEDAYIDLPRM